MHKHKCDKKGFVVKKSSSPAYLVRTRYLEDSSCQGHTCKIQKRSNLLLDSHQCVLLA